ncbi:platelet glycoprotein V-like [Mizuhopecten yessoensis]|uniref:Leucine-rich repeat-containing protein 15 n=1 Tax=Mizuhopecten yessoensis TaxID=6573 RepID=A0A210PG27_MIZYE|nr:platelet glycoprotein V-like [Mizuhopecten yessoensis]OWF35449.1 Leucine-rich repeat-containing protein 15 [Mizuhopecten yessoensis]
MAVSALFLLIVSVTLTFAVDPQGCTYDSSKTEYSCSARSWSLPLVYSDFDNIPQVLKLVDIDGSLSYTGPATFSGFENINTALFDGNLVPALHLRCIGGGSLIVYNGTFDNMGWVKELRIFDCMILSLPDDVFSSFGTLNYFSIDGGSISSMGFNCFNGVNIERMDSVPEPLGMLALRNTQITSGGLPNGVLYSLVNVSTIILDNTHMRVVQKDMFQASTKATHISMKNNPFISLPVDMFEKTTSLTTLELTGIDWVCTCPNLWIWTHLTTYNVSLVGDIVCSSPTANLRAAEYYKTECDDSTPCGDETGIVIGSYCYLIGDITFHGVLLITFIIALVAFAMTVHLKRQTADRKPGDKPRGKRKASGSQWKKVGGPKKGESMA